MGFEIDLLAKYPKTKRDIDARGQAKTEEDRLIAGRFGQDFFDGDRKHGYGGFTYQPRFWQPVVPDFQHQYGLTSESRILDIGCAKGFMLHDFVTLIPGIEVAGIDVSEYAISNSMSSVASCVRVGDARSLPFPDDHFDLVISINTLHNLERDECRQALQEIQRVTRAHSFITVDAYRTDEEKQRMFSWNLTAKTMLPVEEWKELFGEAKYAGDYYWFIP